MRKAICRQAEKLARKHRTSGSKFKLSAICAQGSRVFARGCNVAKPAGGPPSSIHAEDACLRKVPIMAGGDLYICRVVADGTLAISRPCDACMAIIKSKGIDTIHFINRQGSWTSEEVVHER